VVFLEYFGLVANGARCPRGDSITVAADELAWIDLGGRLVRKELPLTVSD
jgi:hypothetical protein